MTKSQKSESKQKAPKQKIRKEDTASLSSSYDFKTIEARWQKKWKDAKTFEVTEDAQKKKYYVLEMFPYPSGSGLHMGHAFNYTIGDIFARYKRMQGFNVLYPMGYDSFGLPAENAAIKAKVHPKEFTDAAVKNFIAQQHALGLSYDWSRMLKTSDPEYYRWNQYLFLKLMEKGLVYRKKASINWCPKCTTVLANEQVHSGKCWRHSDTEVQVRQLEQWFIKTTAYAEELLKDIDSLDWPERIKIMQRNWIGKSHGTEISFELPDSKETNFVLLHGYTGSPDEVFFPWLKKELELRKYTVTVPKLPNTHNPNITEQINFVLKNCTFDENTILLGHSLGAIVAMKVVEKLKKPIKKLIVVSGYLHPDKEDLVKPHLKTFEWKYDFEKIKSNVAQTMILQASNDSLREGHESEEIQKAIGGNIVKFEAEDDHVCGEKEPEVLNACIKHWTIFTTRPDTLFGVTFLVVAAQHPQLMDLVTEKQKNAVNEFLKKIKSTKQEDIDQLEKEGVFTGRYAEHPLSGEKIPIYAGNFVIADYGSGMVMAVPAHDQRDFEFAQKYKIPIKVVIQPDTTKEMKGNGTQKLSAQTMKEAYTGEGTLTNSGSFNGTSSEEAKEKITTHLIAQKKGSKSVQYKLRDWLVSRQRYWGTPIPIVYCEHCGIVPVPEKELPIVLPAKVNFGSGNPLTTNAEFLTTKCSRCGKKARRETDTMDTFFDSSWYFLRFTDSHNTKKPFDTNKARYWMPVDQYIGGAEHACMHLIYARFFTKALLDLGMTQTHEPFPHLFNQGMIHGEDGYVMSKSRGNVIDPLETISKYGADSLRVFLISVASPDKDFGWSSTGVESAHKLVQKMFTHLARCRVGKTNSKDASRINYTLKSITADIENFRYNNGIIALRKLFENLGTELAEEDINMCIRMILPFCPHSAEELWSIHRGKGFASHAPWPPYDENKINPTLDAAEELVEQTIKDIVQVIELNKIQSPQKITLFVAEPWKYTVFSAVKDALKESYDPSTVLKRILAQQELKQQGQEISKLVPRLVKDTKKLPAIVLNQEMEIEALEDAQQKLMATFKVPHIDIVKAQKSKEQKAKQALPGKPALLIG